jgi:CDP-6-deoxy-D-xylo-4-hexulose-3-dehydrase
LGYLGRHTVCRDPSVVAGLIVSDSSSKRRERIAELVRAELAHLPVMEHDPEQGMPLQVVSFGADEVEEALESMLDTWVTMGPKVGRFESDWSDFCGEGLQTVMVNSGSSANLLIWSALVQSGRLSRGDEVLVPAVGWSTTLFPIVQAGLRVVLVDVDPATLCLDLEAARRAMGSRTRAACVVHLLGAAGVVEELEDLGLLVVEDACAAHGACRGGRRVGSLGTAASFSFFFSHHITTIEGGACVTADPELADTLRSMRAHGWVREMRSRETHEAAHPEIDPRFLFVTPGFNLRPTELAGAFGIHQLRRLPAFVARRRANHADWCRQVSAEIPWLRVFPEADGTQHAGFAFPLIVEDNAPVTRTMLMRGLEAASIATRPISGSNLARQPAVAQMDDVRINGSLAVADTVHERGFFVGNSHAFGPAHGALLVRCIQEIAHGMD